MGSEMCIRDRRSTDPGIMMPESGRALIHKEAVKLIEDWINDMES